MKKQYPTIQKIFRNVSDELLETYSLFLIDIDEINNIVPNRIKRKIKNKIEEWKTEGLAVGYFGFLINSITKYTYANCIALLIYGIYAEKEKAIYNSSKETFKTVANDLYDQAINESPEAPKKHKDLTWHLIESWLIIQSVQKTFKEYLRLLSMTAQEEAYKKYIQSLNDKKELDEVNISKMIERQSNRILKINGDKKSGVLDTLTITVGNKAYIEPFKEDNVEAQFIAEVDDRTTLMCKSLNGKIFKVNDWNEYDRYSSADGTYVRYRTFGLVTGENLPPIVNNIHYCRSSITYQIDEDRIREYIDEYLENIENVINEKLKNKNEGSELTKADGWYDNNIFYKVDGKNVLFKKDEEKRNKYIGNWLSNVTGRPVELQPIVVSPAKIKSSDFIFKDNGEKIELKDFDFSDIKFDKNKNYMINKLSKARGQANVILIDITDTPISIEKAIRDIDKAIVNKNNLFVKEVYLKNKNELIGIYIRK